MHAAEDRVLCFECFIHAYTGRLVSEFERVYLGLRHLRFAGRFSDGVFVISVSGAEAVIGCDEFERKYLSQASRRSPRPW